MADDEVHEDIDDRGLGVVALPAPPPHAGGLVGELPAHLRSELAELAEAMDAYAAAAQAPNTTRAYQSDWAQFEAWCARYRLAALPAEPATAALYVTSLARRGLRLSTVRRRAAAITRAHRLAGLHSPIWDPRVLTLLEGIARTLGAAPDKNVALLRDRLTAVVEPIDITTTAGLRDRALLLVGFALGLRRSELVALALADLTPHPDGLTVRIARSKTDQTARGAALLLAYAKDGRPCPVRALRAWLDHAAVTEGEIFRRVTRSGAITAPLSAQSVALIVKKRARTAGLTPPRWPATPCARASRPRPPATATTPPRSPTSPATPTAASWTATSRPAAARGTSPGCCRGHHSPGGRRGPYGAPRSRTNTSLETPPLVSPATRLDADESKAT